MVYIEFKDIFGQCKFFNNLDKLFQYVEFDVFLGKKNK